MFRDRALAMASTLVFASAFLATTERSAHADDDCPIGSVQKKESGETWCEPTVCDTDTNCATGLICRPIPLCVEIGVLDPKATGEKAEAGTKLLVRQRCGEGKSCPQQTTCSEKGRCITLAQADRAGLNGPATAPAKDAPPAKKSCGCDVVGTRGGENIGAALALLGVIVIGSRRRARRS
jgi:MYXO-CTERM domain-containing protein